MLSSRLCNGDHLHAELGGALRQGTQHAFARTLLKVAVKHPKLLRALET
jgi:hypothetical protein